MQKKIGILTFHRALSYGALLQAYALQQKLFALGMDNEMVDYTCDYMVKHYQRAFRPMKGNPAKVIALNLLTMGGIRKERRTRDRFVQQHLQLSRPYSAENIAQAAQQYAGLITGSDQVWSPTCVGFDPVYFLPFARPEQRFSYAASIGVPELAEDLQNAYRHRLRDFALLSLREESGAALVEAVTGREAQAHIDPTLLLTREEWDRLAPPRQKDNPYIFLFTVHKPRRLVEQALALSRKTGMRIVYLSKLRLHRDKAIEYLDPVEAQRFVALIRDAAHVYTNSFHGAAFAALYHKSMVVEVQTAAGRNTRAEELMYRLGLDGRIMTDAAPPADAPVDWVAVDRCLDRERQRAEAYLMEIKRRTACGGHG